MVASSTIQAVIHTDSPRKKIFSLWACMGHYHPVLKLSPVLAVEFVESLKEEDAKTCVHFAQRCKNLDRAELWNIFITKSPKLYDLESALQVDGWDVGKIGNLAITEYLNSQKANKRKFTDDDWDSVRLVKIFQNLTSEEHTSLFRDFFTILLAPIRWIWEGSSSSLPHDAQADELNNLSKISFFLRNTPNIHKPRIFRDLEYKADHSKIPALAAELAYIEGASFPNLFRILRADTVELKYMTYVFKFASAPLLPEDLYKRIEESYIQFPVNSQQFLGFARCVSRADIVRFQQRVIDFGDKNLIKRFMDQVPGADRILLHNILDTWEVVED